jgi:hypothetical protein
VVPAFPAALLVASQQEYGLPVRIEGGQDSDARASGPKLLSGLTSSTTSRAFCLFTHCQMIESNTVVATSGRGRSRPVLPMRSRRPESLGSARVGEGVQPAVWPRRRRPSLASRSGGCRGERTARSSRPIRSVVVAGVGDLYDSSNVLLSPRHALHLLEHLLALTRRRGEE